MGYTAADYQAALLFNDKQAGECAAPAGGGQADDVGQAGSVGSWVCRHLVRGRSKLQLPALRRPARSPDTPHASPINLRPAATAMIAHKVTPDTTIGAEVVRDLAAGTTSFAAGAHSSA